MRYGSYGTVPVYEAVNAVGDSLRAAVAQRIAQRNAEGELALAMKKLELDKTLAQQRGETELAKLTADQDWRMAQARQQQEQWRANQALAQQRLGLDERRVTADEKRASVYAGTQGLQQQALQQKIAQQQRMMQPITLEQAIKESPGIGGHMQTAVLDMLSAQDLQKTAPRSDHFQFLTQVAEKHPGWMIESVLGSGMDRLRTLKERMQTEPDAAAVQQMMQEAEQIHSNMAVLSKIGTAETIDEQLKLAGYMAQRDPEVQNSYKPMAEAAQEALEFIRKARKDLSGTRPEDIIKEMQGILNPETAQKEKPTSATAGGQDSRQALMQALVAAKKAGAYIDETRLRQLVAEKGVDAAIQEVQQMIKEKK